MAKKTTSRTAEKPADLEVGDLVALLNHFVPGHKPEDLAADLATRRDGTVVYIGDVTIGDPDDEEDAEDAREEEEEEEAEEEETEATEPADQVKTPAKAKPATTRRAASKADQKTKTPAYDSNTFGDGKGSL